MENIKNYFEKNGFIYGVSSKYEFGHWGHCIKYFTTLDSALEWLNTEEYDSRERELMTEPEVKKLVGAKAFREYMLIECVNALYQ